MIDRVRCKFKPKQLVLIPKQHLWYAGEEYLLERTLHREWLHEWLGWLKWYCEIALAPNPSLEELLNPPMVSTTWKRNTNKRSKLKKVWLSMEVLGPRRRMDSSGLYPHV